MKSKKLTILHREDSGAEARNRTGMPLRAVDFESCASLGNSIEERVDGPSSWVATPVITNHINFNKGKRQRGRMLQFRSVCPRSHL